MSAESKVGFSKLKTIKASLGFVAPRLGAMKSRLGAMKPSLDFMLLLYAQGICNVGLERYLYRMNETADEFRFKSGL